MNRISNTKCDVCLRRGVQTKARTICNECREFLCKECSDTHLLHRSSMNHNLIDLNPPDEEPRSANEDELASDFLEHVTVSETTILYRAQVAVERGACGTDKSESTQKSKTKEEHVDVDFSKPTCLTKVFEFSVSRPDDKKEVYVTGVLTLNDKIVITDGLFLKLKLFNLSGNFLSSTDIEHYPWGITRINGDQFATCGIGHKVLLWSVRGQTIIREDETYDVDHYAYGIHYNGTYYCVLHRDENAVTILDRQGRRVRKIVIKEAFGKKIRFEWDIHIDSDKHNIYVPCWLPNNGVLCMSLEGEALWFTPLSYNPRGITPIHGVLCVADITDKCFHLISKTGQYIKKLPEKEELDGRPMYIYYDEEDHKLYVSHYPYSDKKDIISVYTLK